MAALILVVDDTPMNLKLATDLLQFEGHTVVGCRDAEEALLTLASDPLPDLVLMDIALPGMDGLALTRHLLAQPRFARLKVVAMTAFAMKGDEQKALDAGCSGYITKPIDTRRLPSQVAAFLAPAAPAGDALKIMIVEDHRIDLKLAGDHARLSGHLVLSSTTAEAALAALENSHPDVVLLDLNLPGMDGLAFLRTLKADPAVCHLPVVAVTAYPDEFRRTELLAAGCAAYLCKPVDMKVLLQVLEGAAVRPVAAPAP